MNIKNILELFSVSMNAGIGRKQLITFENPIFGSLPHFKISSELNNAIVFLLNEACLIIFGVGFCLNVFMLFQYDWRIGMDGRRGTCGQAKTR